jgi:L,D-transpeptidase catalytic domain
VARGYLKMGPKTMATSGKVAFSIAVVPAACLRGKGAWLAATAIGLVCFSGTTTPADAGFLFGDSYSSRSYGYGGYGYGGGMNVASRTSGHRRGNSSSDTGASTGTAKGQAKQEPPKPPAGPLIIVVSIGSQHVTVYDDGTPIMSGPVSTGMPGHPTPMGIFSVIQKDRYHHSNIYSGAPMPYMQRITWSGVAMHEGVVPGHPASHGCIRLTHDFAARLWTTTKMGVRVIVTPRNEIVPQQFDHPSLVALATKPSTPDVAAPSTPAPAPTMEKTEAPLPTYSSLAPPAMSAQPRAALGEGLDVSGDSVLPAPETVAFDQQPGDMHPAVAQALPSAAPVEAPAPLPAAPAVFEKPLKPGLVSVFVSRKAGKIYVRKGNDPIFDMPVTISHPEAPIGTYLFTAGRADETGKLHWLVSNVASGKATVEPPKKVVGRRGSRQEVVEAPAPVSPTSANEALDRIQIPQEALDRIAPLVTPGASLIVSDLGMSGETGKDTDFIILAR